MYNIVHQQHRVKLVALRAIGKMDTKYKGQFGPIHCYLACSFN